MRKGRLWLVIIVGIFFGLSMPIQARDGSLKIDTNRYDATKSNEITYSEQERLFAKLFTTDLTELINRHLQRQEAPRQALAPQLFQAPIQALDRTAKAKQVAFTSDHPTQRVERYNHRLAITDQPKKPYLWLIFCLALAVFCGLIYYYYFRPKRAGD